MKFKLDLETKELATIEWNIETKRQIARKWGSIVLYKIHIHMTLNDDAYTKNSARRDV